MRVVAERGSDGTAGTVHATVVVPDFAREAPSLSGVAIGRGDGRRIAGRADLDGLLPFAPTAARTFERGDRVGALLRVHQVSNRVAAVTMATSITDAMGEVLRTQSHVIEALAFENGVAEHRFEGLSPTSRRGVISCGSSPRPAPPAHNATCGFPCGERRG